MSSECEKEFEIFSSNINKAARSFYYHTEINKQIYDDCKKQKNGYFQYSKLYQAIDANAQFWNDYKYSSLTNTIVLLGRIFDKNKKSHGIRRLVKIAKESDSDRQDIDPSEYFQFLRYIVETIKMWEQVKDVRNKFYAHQDVMSDISKKGILEKAKYSVFDDIIKRLLTIERGCQHAYYNGRLPDLEYRNEQVFNKTKEDVTSLLSRLV